VRVSLETLTVVAFLDPASSKKLPLKRVRARSAIIVSGQDALGRVFVLHAWADRIPTSDLIDKVFAINEAWKPRRFGIEANAMQSLFADVVNHQAKVRMKRLPLVAVTQDTKVDKDWRIRSGLQPVIAEGRLFKQETQYELIAELTSFPMSVTKDLVDALASAVALLPRPIMRRERDREMEDRLAYLRETGADPRYIEAVARGNA
jgi:hypothetical protein